VETADQAQYAIVQYQRLVIDTEEDIQGSDLTFSGGRTTSLGVYSAGGRIVLIGRSRKQKAANRIWLAAPTTVIQRTLSPGRSFETNVK
jgi:hypothetical protein